MTSCKTIDIAKLKIFETNLNDPAAFTDMNKIKVLPEALINKIAAGEVVERPASVVKELVENAIDAGSDQIFIAIKNGGKDFISILDNGSGMSGDDAQLAIERHATSKILTSEDLENINTMGFRGEALAAIAAVSRFEVTTCSDEEAGGFQVRVEGGKLTQTARIGFPLGTRIIVENLFFNTPARQKFMKSVNTEYNHIHELIIRLALGHPQIQFRLTHNKTVVLNLPKGQNFSQRIQHCFGSDISADLIECQYEESYLSFEGLISHPAKNRASKRWQHIFINNRYVKNRSINHAIYSGYRTLLMKNMHPMFFLKLKLMPQEIDVNVHPAKTEIRLKNPNLIHTIFSEHIARILKSGSRNQLLGKPKSEDIEREQSTEKRETPNIVQKPTIPATEFHSEKNMYIEPNEQIGFNVPTAKTESATQSSSHFLKQTESEVVPIVENNPFDFSAKSDFEVNKKALPIHSNFHVIGQLHNKYILAQGENRLIVIDQHAAHERIRFEEIRNLFYSRELEAHPMLIPIMMELPPQDGLLLEQYQDSWEKLGFVIDHFGGNDYSIKEIPFILKDSDIPKVIREVLDEMSQFGKSGRLEEFFNQVFERMACHSSIRASHSLSIQEMDALIDQLINLNIQLYCPHGRPILIEIEMNELDKRFKR